MSLIGIDIGNNNCKIALRTGSGMRLVSQRMPNNMVRNGEMASPEAMSSFLRGVRASEHVRERNCALVLSSTQVFFRHVSLPPMTVSELMLNLPYEFRDFITGDPEEYVYDYAVDELVRDEQGQVVRMELYIAAVEREVVNSYSTMLKKAGFKLKVVTPAQMAYARLLAARSRLGSEAGEQGSAAEEGSSDIGRDVVLIDLGHADVAVSLFHGARYDSMRLIDFGCDEFDRVIADLKGIDPYTASSYKFNNFENVLDEPECLALCERFAVEVSKVVNFYNFSNPDSEIGEAYFLGGGASISELTRAISDMLSVTVHDAESLLPAEAQGLENGPACALAVGALLEGEAI